MFFRDLKSCMLYNVKRSDDVTTAELNHVGFWFESIRQSNRVELIKIDYS